MKNNKKNQTGKEELYKAIMFLDAARIELEKYEALENNEDYLTFSSSALELIASSMSDTTYIIEEKYNNE